MRKVRMMVTLSGDRFHFIPGQEVEFEKEEAQRLVENHYAQFVDSKNDNNDEFDMLKAKANTLKVEFTKKTTFEELTALVQAKEESIALDALKAKADELKIEYGENVTVEELTKLIEEEESK